MLHSFVGSDGAYPFDGLIFDTAGNLYGTTSAGGSGDGGIVFELISNGNGSFTESILHTFSGGASDGDGPITGLAFDKSGNLYGATGTGGGKTTGGDGVIFQLTPGSGGQWSENILHVFTGASDGRNPSSGGTLALDQANNLYGTTSSGGPGFVGEAFRLTPTITGPWTKSTVYAFAGSDGAGPWGNLVMDTAGNFYGTTLGGGSSKNGEVFKLAQNSTGSWVKTTLYSFKGTSDGSGPFDLVLDTAGNLYGITFAYYGTVFELKPNGDGTWTESTLYTFNLSDGYFPAGLTLDSIGNLYGVAGNGGLYASGIVYELANNGNGVWTKSDLYTFTGRSDGGTPRAGVVFDGAGNLYGTASFDGSSCCGVVFELSPSSGGGWTESVLYSFTGGSDGAYPVAGLVFDPAGNLYGTTSASSSGPTVFTLTHSSAGWTESVLHSFTGGTGGGTNTVFTMPGLVIDAAGNLYGTTPSGGDATCNYGEGCGVVFELSPGANGQWTENVLHSFTGYPTDGGDMSNPLIMDGAGNLYGGTVRGGTSGDGVIFEVTP